MDSWIAQMCRSRARRQTLGWVVVFLAGAALVLSNGRYVRNFVEGPFALQPTELAQVTDLETAPDYFVSVTGEKVIDTEIQEVTTTTRILRISSRRSLPGREERETAAKHD
jgi:hypothetical protein